MTVKEYIACLKLLDPTAKVCVHDPDSGITLAVVYGAIDASTGGRVTIDLGQCKELNCALCDQPCDEYAADGECVHRECDSANGAD